MTKFQVIKDAEWNNIPIREVCQFLAISEENYWKILRKGRAKGPYYGMATRDIARAKVSSGKIDPATAAGNATVMAAKRGFRASWLGLSATYVRELVIEA
jgi:hypothetical protein